MLYIILINNYNKNHYILGKLSKIYVCFKMGVFIDNSKKKKQFFEIFSKVTSLYFEK